MHDGRAYGALRTFSEIPPGSGATHRGGPEGESRARVDAPTSCNRLPSGKVSSEIGTRGVSVRKGNRANFMRTCPRRLRRHTIRSATMVKHAWT